MNRKEMIRTVCETYRSIYLREEREEAELHEMILCSISQQSNIYTLNIDIELQ